MIFVVAMRQSVPLLRMVTLSEASLKQLVIFIMVLQLCQLVDSSCSSSDDTACIPDSCSIKKSCFICMTSDGCMWCHPPGNGTCMALNSTVEKDYVCNTNTPMSDTFPYSESSSALDTVSRLPLSCVPENECATDRDDCSPLEECRDTVEGFKCQCITGYEKRDGVCEPICTVECRNGRCAGPNTCECNFGFVGDSCQWPCNCNGHSLCPSPERLDNCLHCQNHTAGAHCELCEPNYVRINNACVSCRAYCNNHSDVCIPLKTYSMAFADAVPNTYSTNSAHLTSVRGSIFGQSTVICNCSEFTYGQRCDTCSPGYFRVPGSSVTDPCIKCQCNGHSVNNTCNPNRGDGCDCQNNTESTRDCADGICWRSQCSTCKEKFQGQPINGHQCYRELVGSEEDTCISAAECVRLKRSKPLGWRELTFYVLTPEYSNVDVRILIDVAEGLVDVFIAAADVFAIYYDEVHGCHQLFWHLSPSNEIDYKASRNYSEPCSPVIMSDIVPVVVKDANGSLATYIRNEWTSSILWLRSLTDHSVVVIPSTVFDLKMVKLYIVIQGRSVDGSRGNLIYSQDRSHFDLFIFFTVFFACFFLKLTLALLFWRLRIWQAHRIADRAQTLELLSLANRPFVCTTVELKEWLQEPVRTQPLWPFATQLLRKKNACIATLLVRMPGGRKTPAKLAIASALIWTPKSARSMESIDDESTGTKKSFSSPKLALRAMFRRIQPV